MMLAGCRTSRTPVMRRDDLFLRTKMRIASLGYRRVIVLSACAEASGPSGVEDVHRAATERCRPGNSSCATTCRARARSASALRAQFTRDVSARTAPRAVPSGTIMIGAPAKSDIARRRPSGSSQTVRPPRIRRPKVGEDRLRAKASPRDGRRRLRETALSLPLPLRIISR